jgi:hypothetical protein
MPDTDSCFNHSFPVVPNTGVPPADVLAIMFPDKDNSTFATMTLADYNASFNAVQGPIS